MANYFSDLALGVDPGTTQARFITAEHQHPIVIDSPPVALWPNDQLKPLEPLTPGASVNWSALDASARTTQTAFRGGKVVNFHAAEPLLKDGFQRLRSGSFRKPKVVFGISLVASHIDDRAIQELIEMVGCRNTFMIQIPVAGAIGAGLDCSQPEPVFFGVLGACATEFSVASATVSFASSAMEFGWHDVVRKVGGTIRASHGAWPEQEKLEGALQAIGVDGPIDAEAQRLLDEAQPFSATTRMTAEEARTSMQAALGTVSYMMQSLLDSLEPKIADRLVRKGLQVAGGMAQLRGLSAWLGREISAPIVIPSSPRECVIQGIRTILEEGGF